MISEWAKIKHVETGHELLPSQVDDYLKNNATRIKKVIKKEPVKEPDELSSFLSVHKAREGYLYCHLTRSQLPNDLHHAELHINGKTYRHKFYEWLRHRMAARRNELVSSMKLTRKLIEHGRIKKLKLGDLSKNNSLDKGFLKKRKYR